MAKNQKSKLKGRAKKVNKKKRKKATKNGFLGTTFVFLEKF